MVNKIKRKITQIILSVAICLSLIFNISINASAVETKSKQAIVVDFQTGAILFEKAANEKMAPSSMSKLMTVYLAFDLIKTGQLKMDQEFHVSEKAWKMEGSRMFVEPNTPVKLDDLLKGIIIQSGNDACVVLAEGVAGSEEVFADRLNTKAAELGLTSSHFVNSTGLPVEGHYMSAADLAKLATRLIKDFPEYYNYFSEKEFTYNNITQGNRNTLLDKNLGVDGLKTGHSSAGGYGIVISANKDGRRLISVVNGLSSMAERIQEARSLLEYGSLNYKNINLAKASEPIIKGVKIYAGSQQTIDLVTKEDVIFTAKLAEVGGYSASVVYNDIIQAPASLNDQLGKLVVKMPDGTEKNYSLHPSKPIDKAGFFVRIYKWMVNLFSNFSVFSPKGKEVVVKLL